MAENQHLGLVQIFVKQLYDSGVRDVCVSPGSRSTPLTMAFARHGGFSIWSILDERSAGFFAVGMTRAKRQPVALVCTSGTAAGNYLPAIMEAHNARLPLLILTADRPPELYDSGANQTTHQVGIYAQFVKWEHQMPVPESTDLLRRHARSAAFRAFAVSSTHPQGPVHINWPFREPLIIPSNNGADFDSAPEVPALRLWHGLQKLDEQQLTELQQDFHRNERGMIVCGPTTDEQSAQAIVELAEVYGWPIIADPLSHIRTGNHRKENVMNTADLLLRSSSFQAKMNPEIILRFGSAPTSKSLQQYLERYPSIRQIVVDVAPVWTDPGFTASDVIPMDPAAFCADLVNLSLTAGKTTSLWLEQWQAANAKANELLQFQAAEQFWYEGQVVPEILGLVPQRANIFVGNSMPIRDFDSFEGLTSKSLRLFANRGVSGIDGVVSSALGVAAANRSEPTVLVIGDVSFYHDLNALLAAKRNGLDLLVVVVNNDGGGIFSFLAQAQYEDTFHHFRTPHGVNFAGTAQLYDASYASASDWPEFRDVLEQLLRASGLRIVELTFDSSANQTKHTEIAATVIKGVEDIL